MAGVREPRLFVQVVSVILPANFFRVWALQNIISFVIINKVIYIPIIEMYDNGLYDVSTESSISVMQRKHGNSRGAGKVLSLENIL